MSGYSGWSMSNNAVDAYESGEKPLSKWNKNDILKRIDFLIEDENISVKFDLKLLKKMNLKSLKDTFLTQTSWHHTSLMYNKTNFYSVDIDTIEELTDEKLKKIISDNTVEKKEELKPEYAKCKFLIWSGSRNHPKAKEYIENGIIIGNWFYRSDGSKKSINSNGFKIIEKMTLDEYKAQQAQKSIDVDMSR